MNDQTPVDVVAKQHVLTMQEATRHADLSPRSRAADTGPPPRRPGPRAQDVRPPETAERGSSGHLTTTQKAALIQKSRASGGGINILRSGREFAKTGMIASATTMVLTGFRLLKPLNPLHRVAGVAFLAFTVWHVAQNEKIVRRKGPAKHGNSKAA